MIDFIYIQLRELNMTGVCEYLKRIGLSEQNLPLTLQTLQKIQYNHVCTVPYENIDLVEKRPIVYTYESLFDKIVRQRRGGFCFELNMLLSLMLREMGFEVCDYFARFLRGEESLPKRRHRVVGVKLDGCEYLCDVGIGQKAPRMPLKLVLGEVQEICGEYYKILWDDFLGYVVYDLYKGEWRRFYSFTPDKAIDRDFEPTSYYCECHPNSNLNKKYILSLKTPSGRITIDGRDYKEFSGDEIVHIEENITNERFISLLKNKFGINIQPLR